MLDAAAHDKLPAAPGVGYKPQHFAQVTTDPGTVKWLEIHAENYMGDGGRPLAQLRHLAEKFAMSVHGVGLSIGSEGPLDKDHLARLKHLVGWLNPASFSEHLAWSTHDSHFYNDLLPLPYTDASLQRICDHIDEVQETIGRRMLLENPSSYLAFAESTWAEPDFLAALAQRTGCGLLLDQPGAGGQFVSRKLRCRLQHPIRREVDKVVLNTTRRDLCPRACSMRASKRWSVQR